MEASVQGMRPRANGGLSVWLGLLGVSPCDWLTIWYKMGW